MMTLPVINMKLDPLDALLTALGLRLIHLGKSKNNPAFDSLIEDKNVTLLFTSDNGVARHYRFENGKITQSPKNTDTADLTIHFQDSLKGAKLLAKADTIALMSAIQDGDMKVTGDYKLILWFASVAKQAAKIPEEYKPYVETAKPYLDKARPYAYKASELARKLIGKAKHKA